MGFWSKLKDKITKKDIEQELIIEQPNDEISEKEIIEVKEDIEEILVDKTKTEDVLETLNEVVNKVENNLEVKDAIKIEEEPIIEVESEAILVEKTTEKVIKETTSIKTVSQYIPDKKDVKRSQKELKRKQKEALKKQKAERAMLKSSLDFSKDIKKLSKKYKEADDEFFEELEEVLIKTDMGMKMVLKISSALQKKAKRNASFDDLKEMLIEELYESYLDRDKKPYKLNFVDGRLNIFMVVGVNGTGKTTSLSKIANFYAEQNKKVLIAAGDTFRAGAVEQLEEWVATRLDGSVDLIKGAKAHQDPASVIFDAIEKSQLGNYDLLLIDTAGRLQNKVNLMKELEKMHQIVHKFDKAAPHELLLVIDATTGQNGVIQAQSFGEITKVTGIILTKMDGTSKGGIALAIKDQLDIPVKLMGIGEQVDDIIEFDVEKYVYGLAAGFMEDDQNEEK